MNKITTLFVVSLLLTCMYIPCVAAAGNNEGPRVYDAQAIRRDGGNGPNINSNELYGARDAYRNNRTPENRQILTDAAKDHLLQMLDHMIGRLELLQERIEFAEEKSILMPEDASDNIDRYVMRLESYKPEVEAAATKEDIQSVARSINQEWVSIRREILRYAKYIAAARTEVYIDKAKDISDRLDAKISEFEGEGADTANLRQNLDDFDEKLVCVEENYELAKDAVSDDEVNPGEVQQYIRNTSRCIREANSILREMFKEIRSLDGYEIDIDSNVSEEDGSAGDDSANETGNETDSETDGVEDGDADTSGNETESGEDGSAGDDSANETGNETDSETGGVEDGDADTSGNETESGTDDSEAAS